VSAYRIRLNQIGAKGTIINKKLSSTARSYTFTRSFQLENSIRPRGDIRGSQLRYKLRVEAINQAGRGPIAKAKFVLRIRRQC